MIVTDSDYDSDFDFDLDHMIVTDCDYDFDFNHMTVAVTMILTDSLTPIITMTFTENLYR